MKRVLLAISLMLFMCSISFAQDKDKLSLRQHKSEIYKLRQELKKEVVADLDMIDDVTEADLYKIQDTYPYVGIGLGYDSYLQKISSDGVSEVKVKVAWVFNDSSAEKAGVRPGDLIYAINEEFLHSLNQFKQLLGDSDFVELRIDRGDEVLSFHLEKSLIGQKIRDFIDQNMDRWQDRLKAEHEVAGKLRKELKMSGNNWRKLLACSKKSIDSLHEVSDVLRESVQFIDSQRKMEVVPELNLRK